PSTLGVLQGHVRVAGRPVAITVGARTDEYPTTVAAQTRSNTDGWYRFSLPPALYRIQLDSSGRGYFDEGGDVVRVGTGVRSLDVLRGKLSVHVAVSPALNERPFYCSLFSASRHSSSASATAHGGILDLEFPVVVADRYRLQLDSNGST